MIKIEKLSDRGLARLLLRKLWQMHDTGGISHGRSYRNRLLEAIIDLIPNPELRDLDFFSFQELIQESKIRNENLEMNCFANLAIMKSRTLKTITNRSLAYLVLLKLWYWYDERARKEKESFDIDNLVPLSEKEVVDAVLSFFLPDTNCFDLLFLDDQILIEEQRDRNYKRFHKEFEASWK